MAKDARQADDEPVDDASSDASSPDAALTGDPNHKAFSGPKPKPAIVASDIQGLQYFEKLKPLLARLYDIGTERDKAGNRQPHMDEYCILQLLWMFSPILTSLRALQQASELDKVRKKLGVGRASGFPVGIRQHFRSRAAKKIAAELAAQLPQPSQGAFDLIGKTLTAVDGSVVAPSSPARIYRVQRPANLPPLMGRPMNRLRNDGIDVETTFVGDRDFVNYYGNRSRPGIDLYRKLRI